MNIIETFNRGSTPQIQTAVANRDQDRYVMITFPTSQIQNPVLPRRPSIRHGGARANMPLPRQTSPSIFLAYRRFPHLPPTNHARQRRQPTHSSVPVALTHLRRAQTSIALGARGATACHFPRVRSLAAFGRRLRWQAASLPSAGIRNPQQQRTSWGRRQCLLCANSGLMHRNTIRPIRHLVAAAEHRMRYHRIDRDRGFESQPAGLPTFGSNADSWVAKPSQAVQYRRD